MDHDNDLENIESNLKNVEIVDDHETNHVQQMKDQHNPTRIQIINKMKQNPHQVQDVEDAFIGKNNHGKPP